MRVLVHEDAARRYCSRFIGQQIPNREWADILSKIQGQWIEVETEFLFAGQVNTVPIPGVSESGLRLMDESIAKIEDDLRIGRKLCRNCHHHTHLEDTACSHCKSSDHFEFFFCQACGRHDCPSSTSHREWVHTGRFGRRANREEMARKAQVLRGELPIDVLPVSTREKKASQ